MKIQRDLWSFFAFFFIATAALILIYKPFPSWSGILGLTLLILSIATTWGRDGYSSDKPASEKSIEKAKFWVAVFANLGVLLAIAGDA